MKKIILCLSVLLSATNCYAEVMRTVCYWEVQEYNGTIRDVYIARDFAIDIGTPGNNMDMEETKKKLKKLQILFEDHVLKNEFGHPAMYRSDTPYANKEGGMSYMKSQQDVHRESSAVCIAGTGNHYMPLLQIQLMDLQKIML